jgi:hypothetical protein
MDTNAPAQPLPQKQPTAKFSSKLPKKTFFPKK